MPHGLRAHVTLPADPLDRHQARRRRATPTVTVLTGQVGCGLAGWLAWAERCGWDTVRTGATTTEAAAQAWAASVADGLDLVSAAARATSAAGAPGPVAALAGITLVDLDALWRRLPSTFTGTPVGRACAELLPDAGDPSPLGRLAALSPLDQVAALFALAGPDQAPTLLLDEPRPAGDIAWLVAALRAVEPIAAAVPELPIALAVPSATYDALLVSAASRTRSGMLAREGAVPVGAVTADDVAARLSGLAHPPRPAAVARLIEDGAHATLIDRYAAAAAARTPLVAAPSGAPAVEPQEGHARSAAEQFLFDRLQSLPETAGRFVLNARLPFDHGPRPAEVDLLAPALRLVVEIDGAAFHLVPDQYRRDRRKDWLLHERGYRVVRVLAEDVVDRLPEILDTVLDAVAVCAADRRRP